MKVSVLKALAGYFNAKGAPNYKPLRDFSQELKALTDAEKLDLAQGVVAITGDELETA